MYPGEEDGRRRTSMGSFFNSRAGWVCLILLALAAFYLIAEHRAHMFEGLPLLLLLACPLLHIFMHGGGHGGHDHGQRPDDAKTSPSSKDRGAPS